MKSIYYILKTARPKQWIKNLLVFAGLVYSHDIMRVSKLSAALLAFIAFCLVSSAVYLMNDIFDRKKDALHPVKKNRPIAAGKLTPIIAWIAVVFFIATSLYIACSLYPNFAYIIIAYFIMNLAYSIKLKKVVIVDVLIIALGFMFRIIGGTIAIQEPISSWLIICASFLTLFLALGKRRAELVALGENASEFRKTLTQYNPQFLNNMMMIVVTGCLMSYALYTLDHETVEKVGNQHLIWSFPFVVYGLFRYLYLLDTKSQGEAPEETILKDFPILLNILLFLGVIIDVIYIHH